MLLEILASASMVFAVINSMGLILNLTNCFRYKSRLYLVLVSVAGWISGYMFERGNFSLPQVGNTSIYVIPLIMLSVLTAAGYPTSISQLYVSVLLGYSLASNFTQGVSSTGLILLSWLISFVSGLLISMLIKEILAVLVRPTNIEKALTVLKSISVSYVFLLSYVLGGNVLSTIMSLLGLKNDLGSLLLVCASVSVAVPISLRTSISLGLTKVLFPTKYLTSLIPYTTAIILTQIANRLGLPLVLSLLMFSSTVGVGLTSKLRLFHRRKIVMYLVGSYILPFLISASLSYLISLVL
jgi:hypothetical protein